MSVRVQNEMLWVLWCECADWVYHQSVSLSGSLFFILQLRREKIDLENTLEQEQEALVNRLWKRMDKLEAEKRFGI